MALQLYNTLSGARERFVPIHPGRVTLYVCGPTVYNLPHIGNARPAVVFDTLFRLLQTQFQEVIYARNITDIDDKIIQAMAESGRTLEDITGEFTDGYRRDMARLQVLPPTLEPLATMHMADMIGLIGILLEKGHAYQSQGHVLFAVQSMAEYGRLSGRSLEDMQAGARVEVAAYKRYPGDFVLWKPAGEDEPGWASPWGRGRPGWHLECSAMVKAHFGNDIDIHGGGRDLIFPHHENELAQSRCAHGGTFVNYWMHNAYLDIDGEKMSKSLDNFRLVRDLLEHYPGEVLRFALLSAHYRSALNFSVELLDSSRMALDGLYTCLRDARAIEAEKEIDTQQEAFYAGLNNDLNTPVAIAELHALARGLNGAPDREKPRFKARLLAAADLLGLLQQDPDAWFQSAAEGAIGVEEIEQLLARRQQARRDGDFARADRIRQQLESRGVLLEDKRSGTQWRRG